MKIAAVTDDGTTISRHFGQAHYYVILTLEDEQVVARQQVEKPAHHHGHGHQHDHQPGQVHLHDEHDHGDHEHGPDQAVRHADMFAPLQECDILLTRGMGRGAHIGLLQIGVQPIITEIATIDEAVAAVIDGSIIDHPEKLH
ncbi:MAG: NifB/NifX family molybdenum-iron cluster-binding protein [Anaerolineae bacterium]|nr:NifB/NifX family molybdenum-iron cluster-binding protein [Anaerolineae bacterium]